jgi:RadC-like JAB domain
MGPTRQPASEPRSSRGFRVSPARATAAPEGDAVVRYRLKTVHITLAQEPVQRVASPATAEAFLRAIVTDLDADREHFILLALDAQNQARGYKVIATGGQNNTAVDLRTVFRDALLLGAAATIVGHNHPPGDPTPSGEDTKRGGHQAHTPARAGRRAARRQGPRPPDPRRPWPVRVARGAGPALVSQEKKQTPWAALAPPLVLDLRRSHRRRRPAVLYAAEGSRPLRGCSRPRPTAPGL